MDSSLSTAPLAWRSPPGSALGGLRFINPVVNDRRPTAAAETTPESTRYTPSGGSRATPAAGAADGVVEPGDFNPAITRYQALSQSLSWQRNDRFELSIRTAEGDIANIHIAQAHSESSHALVGRYATAGSGGGLLVLSNSKEDSLQLQIGVTGELNDAETASINALLQKMQGVADDFFGGDVAQATQAASGLGLGGGDNSLAAFSFELQTQESLRAVTAYRSVAAMAPPLPEAAAPRHEPAAEVDSIALSAPSAPGERDFLRQLLSMLEGFSSSAAEGANNKRAENIKPPKLAVDEPQALPPPAERSLSAEPAL